MRRSVPILLACVVLLGCGTGEGGYRIRGTLRDAETGEPVSRDTFYLHFFHDESGVQKTLDPESDADYEISMPATVVRLRFYDRSGRYELFEETVELTEETTRLDPRLRPTDRVLLTVTVVDAKTGRPIVPGAGGGHGPLLSVSGPDGFSEGMIPLGAAGSFSVRVPRGPLVFRAVDTAMTIANPELDLTGHEDATMAHVLRFE